MKQLHESVRDTFVEATIKESEGFRVRMDKLPEKKNHGQSAESNKMLNWNDFNNVEHLIDSSRYCEYTILTILPFTKIMSFFQ